MESRERYELGHTHLVEEEQEVDDESQHQSNVLEIVEISRKEADSLFRVLADVDLRYISYLIALCNFMRLYFSILHTLICPTYFELM